MSGSHSGTPEQEARDSFEQLFQGSPTLMALARLPDRVITKVNRRFLSTLGYTRGEVEGRTSQELGLFADANVQRTVAEEALRTGHVGEISMRVRCKDGTLRDGLFSGEVIQIQGESFLLTRMIDITDLMRVERELKASQESLLAIYNSVSEAIYIQEWPGGRFIDVNRGAEVMYRRPRSELVGLGPQDVGAPGRNDLEALGRMMDRVFATGVPAEFEFWGVRKDGEAFPKDVIVNKGRYFGRDVLIATARDISQQKQVEAERERLRDELNQAQKMESIGRLAGGVAHDFNNMLGVILGHAEMALEQIDANHPVHADLDEINKAAKRSAELTRRLLAYARKQTAAPRVLDLNETVEGMLSMLRRLIGENMELVWRPGRDLGPVKIDPVQVDQILANLCVNARDAIKGVGRVVIETGMINLPPDGAEQSEGLASGEYIWVTVTDNGCGMDAGVKEHLFEPYFTTKGLGKGTGLGLAMVYGIVRQNEGCIQVQSEPGRGTSIRILLPRHTGPAGHLSPDRIPPARSPGRQTILLVEDEPAILNLVRKGLERLGYAVLAAATPGEAVRMAETHAGDIHLLITDVIMPEMNGRDLARRLIGLHPGMRRMFMSGYTADVIAHHGVLEEGVHFIQKPFSNALLGAKVREALTGSI